MVSVDLEKIYDSIPRKLIWYCLRKQHVPKAYISIIKDMYKDTTRVVTNAGETGKIRVEIGLCQSLALSLFIFKIVMDAISDDNDEDHHARSMLFADDLVLCGESRGNIEERLKTGEGLKVSRSETQYLPPKENSDEIKLKEYDSSDYATLPQKVTFKYLGTTIHQEGGYRTDRDASVHWQSLG